MKKNITDEERTINHLKMTKSVMEKNNALFKMLDECLKNPDVLKNKNMRHLARESIRVMNEINSKFEGLCSQHLELIRLNYKQND